MLKDKVVIIIGACGRLGSAFSKTILDNNAICIAADLSRETEQPMTEQQNSQFFSYYQIDITDPEAINYLFEDVNKKYGRIDALVNASYPRNVNWGKKFFGEVDYKDFCENASLNLGSAFIVAQLICEYFKNQKHGNLIQISSIQGIAAPKFDTYIGSAYDGKDMNSPAEYSIFKAGIINFTRYIAKFYKGYNIRSNCISPGGLFSGQPESFLKKYEKCCLTKGMLDPEDVCGSLLYLLSDMSTYVNGQNIVVDDGWSL